MDNCDHPVRLKGLCAVCGADITNYAEPTEPVSDEFHVLHGSLDLTVTPQMAESMQTADKYRLLREKRLSLVVDLDQTVLHATVDSHYEDLILNTEHPDYEHIKDIKKLNLIDGNFTYFIKFRPGLKYFLDRIGELYELHVYTMGSRSYATEIVKLIDPEGKYFADRIISREDSGGPENRKQLKRIFPCDDRTVLIIDDRADVWEYSRNLVQVSPFYFFIGTGDVNARSGMVQHVLPEVNIPTNVETHISVVNFVRDPDHGLDTIFSVLEESHRLFFKAWDYQEGSLDAIPDVKEILDGLKSSIFGGVSLVFSGLAPLHIRLTDSHWWKLAEQYGATCLTDLDNSCTHVISYRCDTSKVMCAVERGLEVVTPEWILNSIFGWERLPEANYRPANLPSASNLPLKSMPLTDFSLDLAEFNAEIDEFLAAEEDTSTDTDGAAPATKRVRLESSGESDSFVDELEQDLLRSA